MCLLLFLNDLMGGWISGRSSALYALVFHDVLTQVFGKTPIPVLVPPALGDPGPNTARLVYDYLVGAASPERSE